MEKCIIDKCRKKAVGEVLDKCAIHHTEEVRERLAEELKDVTTLYFVGVHLNRNTWSQFTIYYIKDNQPVRVWCQKADVPHWNKPKPNWKGGYFENHVWGMDRTFDITYGLGLFLYKDGYKFKHEFLSST